MIDASYYTPKVYIGMEKGHCIRSQEVLELGKARLCSSFLTSHASPIPKLTRNPVVYEKFCRLIVNSRESEERRPDFMGVELTKQEAGKKDL
jgi:hypothetical protein